MFKRLHLTLGFFILSIYSFAQDNLTLIVPDNFPVTDEILEESREKENNQPGMGQVWFGNKALNQTLVFDLGTDYHRYKTYLFYNNTLPDDLIENTWFSDTLTVSENKIKILKSYSQNAKQINKEYFISKQGLKLGDNKTKVLKTYPYKPDDITLTDNIEKYEWKFTGDILVIEGWEKQNQNPLAKDSFGYRVIAYFKNDKLIGLILVHEIP